MNSVHWPEVSPLLRRMLSGQEVTTHADLRLLERHRREIERALTDLCGYRLRIDRHAARLIKIPPKGPMCRPLRVKRNGERVAFDVRRFAVLWATLAALSDGADRGRLQWKLADLVDVIVVEAADAGVSLDMTVADDRRRVVRDVLTCLHDELHILALQDGEPDALRSEEWRERPALYGVDEEALDRLLGVTAQYDSIDDAYRASRRAVEDDREERLAARRALFTEMLEAPVVYTAALDSLQSDVLRRAGREHIVGREDATSVSLSDLFGMQPEYRLEGISLLDPSGESTDSADRFPARSRERQCALLLAAHLTRTDPLGRAA
ncbi:MAG TPA: DUF2398 family protein, partial [Solirubrobacteraceae bacterium]|nr:DUF2398 family protein [Solirubrobacteraceae bacterium]